MHRPGDKWLSAVGCLLLLGVMATIMIAASLEEAQTWDEGGHLVAGYGYWRTGDFGFNVEHPPLGNLLSALPLLPLDLRLATDHSSWQQRAQPIAGAIFLYRNRDSPDRLLFLGRLPTIVLTLLLGVVLFCWTRSLFGVAAALTALLLFVLDPNFLAHGRYITTDVIAALTIFLACIAWGRFLTTLRWLDVIWAGLALGLALGSKYSTLFLLPVLATLTLFRWWQLRYGGTSRLTLGSVAAFAIGLGFVALLYWPQTAAVLLGDLPLASHPYWLGFATVTTHSTFGHPAYLLGQLSDTGWWYYFPVAFLVKTPTAVLVLSLWCGAVAGRQLFYRRVRLRELPVHWAILCGPPLAYLSLTLMSGLNLGIRHLLPFYVFLFVWIAALVPRTGRRARIALVVCLVLLAAESLAGFPHHVAFFNTVSGGPARGHRYLLDSNLDWGQDLKRLAGYLDSTGEKEVCLAYFGTADPAYYGIRKLDRPLTPEADCIAAVSVNLLHDLYVVPGTFSWLREMEPTKRVGYSINVYDLRKQ